MGGVEVEVEEDEDGGWGGVEVAAAMITIARLCVNECRKSHGSGLVRKGGDECKGKMEKRG